MRRLITIIFALVIMSSLAYAQEWLDSSTTLNMNIEISGNMRIVPTSDNYRIDHVIADLSFYPRQAKNQKIIEQITIPDAIENDDNIRFTWNDPKKTSYSFSIDSIVEVTDNIEKVKEKISYPLKNISGFKDYTKASPMIDSNDPEIISLASSLAQGETDQYKIVFKLADWVKTNIRYDLNTLTADAVKNASWVLQNKQGVCDELTNLFIAMNRALGIPARYVSGTAYTNFQDKDDWGPHAWTEIYFQGHGWIPFDITYGQFGYIDPSHIILKHSKDSDETSTDYEWKGQNIDLDTENLNIQVNLMSSSGNINPIISIYAMPLKQEIGFGSYNIINAQVTNTQDYYYATELSLAKPKELSVIGDLNKRILLGPNEKKEISWMIKLDSDLDKDYSYTFPIKVYSTKNISHDASFSSTYKDTIYSKAEMQSYLSSSDQDKQYNSKLSLSCSTKKDDLFIKEDTTIDCIAKNIGNTNLKDLNICLYSDCISKDIPINQLTTFSFYYTPTSIGKKSIIITAKNDKISQSDNIIINIEDKPKISIRDINIPTDVSFDEEYKISFLLHKDSYSSPKDVELELIIKDFKEKWTIPILTENRKININLKANNLKEGANPVKIKVSYKGKDNTEFLEEQDSSIFMQNLSFFESIQAFFNRIANSIKNLFT